jgi:hypothetical protein
MLMDFLRRISISKIFLPLVFCGIVAVIIISGTSSWRYSAFGDAPELMEAQSVDVKIQPHAVIPDKLFIDSFVIEIKLHIHISIMNQPWSHSAKP